MQRRHALSLRALRRLFVGKKDAALETTTDAAEDLRHKLRQLPARHRELLILFYLEELPAKEIAALLHLSENTLNVRLHRARAALAQLLEPPK